MRRTIIARHKIKRAMRGKFSTFGELAEAANISTTTMTKATDSGEWRAATLDALAHALGVSSLSLLEEEDSDPIVAAHVASAPVRELQRSALLPKDAPTDPTLTQAEAERRVALLRQSEERTGRRGG